MTEAEARNAVESACHRADVQLGEFAFYDLQMGNTVMFDGASTSLPAGQTMLCVMTSEHGRKAGCLSGLAQCKPDELERYAYNFAVDWLDEVQQRKG